MDIRYSAAEDLYVDSLFELDRTRNSSRQLAITRLTAVFVYRYVQRWCAHRDAGIGGLIVKYRSLVQSSTNSISLNICQCESVCWCEVNQPMALHCETDAASEHFLDLSQKEYDLSTGSPGGVYQSYAWLTPIPTSSLPVDMFSIIQ